jgi:hypothetical protein
VVSARCSCGVWPFSNAGLTKRITADEKGMFGSKVEDWKFLWSEPTDEWMDERRLAHIITYSSRREILSTVKPHARILVA